MKKISFLGSIVFFLSCFNYTFEWVWAHSLERSSDRISIEDRKTEASRLLDRGVREYRTGQLREALDTLRQVQEIRTQLGDRLGLAETLKTQGRVLNELSEYEEAIETFEDALAIYRTEKNSVGVGETLTYLAEVYSNLGQFPKALEILEPALVIHEQVDNRTGIAETLYSFGNAYNGLSEYDRALERFQRSLQLQEELNDRFGQGRTLQKIAMVNRVLGQYEKALEFYQQALAINQAIGDRVGESRTLTGMGIVYDLQGEYQKALEILQQGLVLRQTTGNRAGIGGSFVSMGNVYEHLGQYEKALESYQDALVISRELGDRSSEGNILNNIAGIDYNFARYARALESYQKALVIVKEIGDRAGIARTLNNIGLVYSQLGEYSEALKFYQEALPLRQLIGDRLGESNTLQNIGISLDAIGQHSQALELLKISLEIRQDIGYISGIGASFTNIGLVYDHLGEYDRALTSYQQALAILKQIDNRPGIGRIFNSIGVTYERLNESTKALDFFQQALGLFEELGDKIGESIALGNIGYLLEQQNQSELAIAFYKKSVNLTEEIRRELQVLPLEKQESFTRTVADTYRALADILLSRNRILEAQQVLELLKVEELREFTHNIRAGGQTTDLSMTATETEILQKHGTLIAFGRKIEECRESRCDQLSQLLDRRDVLLGEYNQTVENLEEEIRRRRAEDDAFLDPSKFSRKAREIVDAKPGTVLIYPLILEDKIWLLWAASGGIVKSVEIPNVGQQQMGETVVKFRLLLKDRRKSMKEVQATGKQLYDWLIKPIESELQANEIENLVFSLDRVTRYIPLSALFDGDRYLVENYTISTILSAELTDMRDRIPPDPETTQVLGLGLSDAVAGFGSLPNVPKELDAIVKQDSSDPNGIYPGLQFLNQDFDFRTLRDNLYGHKILHIATHGAFVPGSADKSYLLLGNGEKLAIPDIATLQDLADVHLVVLSACETALGGPAQDGTEIAGLSYYFLNSGAAAVMASLWKVDDLSTSLLMQQFYMNLAQSTANKPVTKAEALREAQIALINNSSYGHSYFWAPFILIGNGL